MSVTMQDVLAKVSLVPTHVRILRNKMLIDLRFYFYDSISANTNDKWRPTVFSKTGSSS